VPGRKNFDQKLERILDLTQSDPSAEICKELLPTIRGRSNLLAAKAIHAAKAHRYVELIPDLVTAFDRFMEDPVDSDKGCLAKIAIAEALIELGFREHDLFLRGIRHIQMEPAWGEPVDTADELRGRCAEGLVRAGYPDIMFELVRLLSDPQPRTRNDAAHIIASFENETAELLLRMKAFHGDPEPEIQGDVLSSLMGMAPERSLDFVMDFARRPDERVAQEAVLALGSSRFPGALDCLLQLWDEAIRGEVKKMLLLPIALHRSDAAHDALLRIVREEPTAYAISALDALKIYGEQSEGRERIEAAVEARGEGEVRESFADLYPGLR
jgi:HEAT repeat protein